MQFFPIYKVILFIKILGMRSKSFQLILILVCLLWSSLSQMALASQACSIPSPADEMKQAFQFLPALMEKLKTLSEAQLQKSKDCLANKNPHEFSSSVADWDTLMTNPGILRQVTVRQEVSSKIQKKLPLPYLSAVVETYPYDNDPTLKEMKEVLSHTKERSIYFLLVGFEGDPTKKMSIDLNKAAKATNKIGLVLSSSSVLVPRGPERLGLSDRDHLLVSGFVESNGLLDPKIQDARAIDVLLPKVEVSAAYSGSYWQNPVQEEDSTTYPDAFVRLGSLVNWMDGALPGITASEIKLLLKGTGTPVKNLKGKEPKKMVNFPKAMEVTSWLSEFWPRNRSLLQDSSFFKTQNTTSVDMSESWAYDFNKSENCSALEAFQGNLHYLFLLHPEYQPLRKALFRFYDALGFQDAADFFSDKSADQILAEQPLDYNTMALSIQNGTFHSRVRMELNKNLSFEEKRRIYLALHDLYWNTEMGIQSKTLYAWEKRDLRKQRKEIERYLETFEHLLLKNASNDELKALSESLSGEKNLEVKVYPKSFQKDWIRKSLYSKVMKKLNPSYVEKLEKETDSNEDEGDQAGELEDFADFSKGLDLSEMSPSVRDFLNGTYKRQVSAAIQSAKTPERRKAIFYQVLAGYRDFTLMEFKGKAIAKGLLQRQITFLVKQYRKSASTKELQEVIGEFQKGGFVNDVEFQEKILKLLKK